MAEKKISTNFAKSSLALSAFVIIIAVGIGVFIYSNSSSSGTKHDITNPQLTYWPIVLQPWQKDNLRSVKRVFDRLGYRIVNGTEEHWDVMWSLEYPFDRFPEKLIGFKKHQVMNHIPGMTFLTNKMHLAVGTQSKYIPVAFEFPRLKNEFIYYAKINSKAKFVVKNFDNRGVKIVHFKDMDFHLGDKKYVKLLLIDNLNTLKNDLKFQICSTLHRQSFISRWTRLRHRSLCIGSLSGSAENLQIQNRCFPSFLS